jgi:D-alanine--poly(phosphoribitol) ligase subunit 2
MREPHTDMSSSPTKIRDFIEEQFLIEFDDSFSETSDLFKEGVMDSFGYVQLIRFLEKEFSIEFTEKEMTSGVMVSLSQIEQEVATKIANNQDN